MAIVLALLGLIVLSWHVALIWRAPDRWKLLISTLLLVALIMAGLWSLHDALEGYRRRHVRMIAQSSTLLCEKGEAVDLCNAMRSTLQQMDSKIDSFNLNYRLALALERAAASHSQSTE